MCRRMSVTGRYIAGSFFIRIAHCTGLSKFLVLFSPLLPQLNFGEVRLKACMCVCNSLTVIDHLQRNHKVKGHNCAQCAPLSVTAVLMRETEFNVYSTL